jgi:hypothetical protein
VFTHEENMLLLEPARLLLRHFSSSKGLSINEFTSSVNGFESRLHFVGNVLDGNKVNLKRVKLLAEEVREQRLVRLYLYVEVVNGHGL